VSRMLRELQVGQTGQLSGKRCVSRSFYTSMVDSHKGVWESLIACRDSILLASGGQSGVHEHLP
jgi:hypothetical protein